jgi:hypothetical protein
MAELENSNDITQDIEISSYKMNRFVSTQESNSYNSRYEDNKIEMTLNLEKTEKDGNTKFVLSVYGNDLRIKFPSKMGSVYSFIFIGGNPLVIIGPQCIFIFIFSLYVNNFVYYYQLYKCLA